MTTATLEMLVVYRYPSDFPNKYVVRRWTCMATGGVPDRVPLIVCDTLEEARAAVPQWMVRLERQAGDDPVVCEVWL